MLKIYKTVLIITILVFTTSAVAWSEPQMVPGDKLRPQAAADRAEGADAAWSLGEATQVCRGVEKMDVEFAREGRFAKGWAVSMDPAEVEMSAWIDPDMVGYDFFRHASTEEVAEDRSKELGIAVTVKPLPGMITEQFIDRMTPKDRERMVLVGPATQGGFWTANTLVIQDGQLIRKTAPGLFQKGIQSLNGDFYFFVFDEGNVGMRRIKIENGSPAEDISGIKLAFSGPPLIYKGKDMSSLIRFSKDEAGRSLPTLGPYDVNWSPESSYAAFCAPGRDRNGRVVYIALAGDPDQKKEISCAELAELGKQLGLTDLLLGPGSSDVRVALTGEPEMIISKPHPTSKTGKEFPKGRPIGTIFYVLVKGPDFSHRITEAYSGARIAVLGGTGFVGAQYLNTLLRPSLGRKVSEIRALSRNPDRMMSQALLSAVGEKLKPIRGDHLNQDNIRELIKDTKVIIDTAGLAWQHPAPRMRSFSDLPLMEEELLQNAMSAALIGALVGANQRLVWTSSSAIDVMLSRLGPEDQGKLFAEIDERARSYIAYAMRIADEPALGQINSIIQFVQEDLKQNKPHAFPEKAGDAKKAIYADKFSYPYSKFVGQRALELLAWDYKKDIVVVKMSDVYGPGQSIGPEILDPAEPARRLQRFLAVHEAIENGAYRPWEKGEHGFRQEGDEIQQVVWSDYVAPTYIDDAVEILLCASVVDVPRDKIVLDVTAPWISNIEMAEAVRDAVGTNVKIVPGGQREEKPSWTDEGFKALDIKIQDLVPLEEGIPAQLYWHQAQIRRTVVSGDISSELAGAELAVRTRRFNFGDPANVLPGMTVIEGKFSTSTRSADVRALTIDPVLVDLKIWINEEMINYDFATYALPPIAEKDPTKISREIHGLIIEEFGNNPPRGINDEIIFAGCALQSDFYDPNTLLIIDGKAVTKKAPGAHQTREEYEKVKGQDGSIKLTGAFYVFILDAGKVGVRKVEFKKGEPITDISDIKTGISGPSLIINGKPVVDDIKYVGERRPAVTANQVVWDPKTRLTSFSAIGHDGEGKIVYLTASDLSLASSEDRGVYLGDLPGALLKLGVKDAILLGGSMDVQQYLKGLRPIVSSGGIGSESGKYYAKKGGRRLGTILYGTVPDMVVATEPELIDLVQLLGSPALPLVAVGVHHDDIENGTGVFQHKLLGEGRRNIHWMVLTTGADPTGVLDEQIEGHETFSSAELLNKKIELRQRETTAAAGVLGLSAENLTFFQFGAGSRSENFNATMGKTQEEKFIERLKEIVKNLPDRAPVAIAWNTPDDPHPAHSHSAGFVESAVTKFSEETGRPVYALRFRLLKDSKDIKEPNLCVFMSDRGAGIKEKMLLCHKSQIERRKLQGRASEGSVVDETRRKDEANAASAQPRFPDNNLTVYTRSESFYVSQLSWRGDAYVLAALEKVKVYPYATTRGMATGEKAPLTDYISEAGGLRELIDVLTEAIRAQKANLDLEIPLSDLAEQAGKISGAWDGRSGILESASDAKQARHILAEIEKIGDPGRISTRLPESIIASLVHKGDSHFIVIKTLERRNRLDMIAAIEALRIWDMGANRRNQTEIETMI